MNDYDGVVKDSFGHVPTSMVLHLLAAPQGADASKLVSAADHVKTEHRFTDWCEWSQFISVPSTVLVFFEKSNRYDIDNDCVDDGGKEHSAIDHVLISQDLNKAVTRVAYQHDFKPSEFCDITQNVTSYYSDHWPIFVEFELSALYKTWKMSVLSRKSINLWLSL